MRRESNRGTLEMVESEITLRDDIRELRKLDKTLSRLRKHIEERESKLVRLRRLIEARIKKQGEGLTTWREVCQWVLQQMRDEGLCYER